MKRMYLIGIIATALLCTGGAALFFLNPQTIDLRGRYAAALPQPEVARVSGREVPAGEKEYYNPQYKFSLLYPDSLSVKEFPEAGGAMTVTFEYDDKKMLSGFQIFIVPFSSAQITPERFKQDNPSGVRKNLKNITVDGATGASFYSTNATLGDTAEVWFVHGGYLYEVNTFKELDTWLADIMQSWKFTP